MNTITRFVRHLAFTVIFSATILGCSPNTPAAAPPGDVLIAPSDVGITPTVESTTPPDTPSAGQVMITQLDPCKLITKEDAASVLGKPVEDAIAAQDISVSSCTYIAVPGKNFVTVAVYEGDKAKNYLINEIAQLQNGCHLGFSTASQQPTPFPPELEALRGDSIQELLEKDLGLQQDCGLGDYSNIPELGENAYTYSKWVQGALIGVATEDALYTFLVADTSSPPDEALNQAKGFVQLSLTK